MPLEFAPTSDVYSSGEIAGVLGDPTHPRERVMLLRTGSIVLLAGLTQMTACSGYSEESTADISADAPSALQLPEGASTLRSGTFSGRNDHVVTGGVRIASAGGKTFVVLDGSFSLDNAPDPRVGFGSDGSFDEETSFTELASKTGEQVYLVPSSVDPSAYSEVYIWCAEFSVPLGIAELE